MGSSRLFFGPEELDAVQRLLDRDYQHHPKYISRAELRRWMDADERFAAYVRENYPALVEEARDGE